MPLVTEPPPLDHLNPSFGWRELDPDDARVTVAVVSVACDRRNRATIRGEIIESPAYIVGCWGRMIPRADLATTLLRMAEDGHTITVERRDVSGTWFDVADAAAAARV